MKSANSVRNLSVNAAGSSISIVSIFVAAFTLCLSPESVLAQSYPAKPVRLIVPAAPGGGVDFSARNFAPELSKLWGQQVIIENRAGANFVVGTEAASRAAPDGYTMMIVSTGAITMNPLVYPNLPYNAQELAPVMLISAGTFVLMVTSTLPVNNFQEFLAYLRSSPGKAFHASNSPSTILLSELFKSIAKVDYADINYKGGVLAAAATGTGETQFAIVDIGSATVTMRSGRAKVLAVTTPYRSKSLPDVPTFAEAGVPGYASSNWIALFAPAKTPPEIIAKINLDLQKVLADSQVAAKFANRGSDVIASTVDDAVKSLRADSEKWARLVRERKIKFQEGT